MDVIFEGDIGITYMGSYRVVKGHTGLQRTIGLHRV